MRSADAASFRVGEQRVLQMVLEDTIRHLRYRFEGREVKKIRNMGKFNTLKFACQIGTSESFSFTDGSEFFIWLSDDENKIPLHLESPIRVGSVNAYITGYKGLKYPLTSKNQVKMKLTQIDLAEGRGGSQREVSASEAVARAEEACGGTLLLFEPDGVPRAAVAICPGGGFGKVNTEHEGVAFAEWFVAHGIAAGVVKYRLPEGDPALPQQDVERAAELLHNRFDGVKTGVLGASIGGYLAACAALAQPAARRPDFQLLFYPVVSMEEEFAHRPSMLRMFGRELHGLEAKRRSPLYRIDRAAPPAFLAAAADDGAVTPLGACRYAECLLAAGAGAALHLYPSGGHGFGLRREFAWREALVGELRMWLDATIGTV